jgi:hypothetical protein
MDNKGDLRISKRKARLEIKFKSGLKKTEIVRATLPPPLPPRACHCRLNGRWRRQVRLR